MQGNIKRMQELGDEGQQVLDSEFSLAYHRREMF